MVATLTLLGAMMAAGSAIGFYTVPMSVGSMLPKFLNLAEDGMVFPKYKDPPFFFSSKYYIFEVKNRKEFLRGSKLKLALKGPYVFRTQLYRTNVAFKNNQKTVSYDTHRSMVTDEAASKPLDEKFWILNPIVAVLGDQIRMMVIDRVPFKRLAEPIVFNSVNVILSQFKETLFTYSSPREFLEGRKVQLLETMLGLADRLGLGSLIPPGPPDNIFGIVYAQNATSDRQEIYTGIGDTSRRFAEVVTWKDKPVMDIWKGKCNKIEGTNGELYKPFIDPDKPIRIFLGLMCRSLWLDPAGGLSVLENGMRAVTFSPSNRLYQGTKSYPPNECYCKNTKAYDCKYDGLFSMGPCYFDAPIFFSKPRLNGVDRKIRSLLQEDIANIDAMPEYQKFSIDPITGTPLAVNLTFVGLFKVSKQPYMRELANIQNITYAPAFATTEGIDLPLEAVWQLKYLQMLYYNNKTLAVLGLAGGLATMLVGICFFGGRSKREPRPESANIPTEREKET